MESNLKTILRPFVFISFLLASCGTKSYQSGCINVLQGQLLTEISGDFEVDSELLTLINSRDLFNLTSYAREHDYSYYTLKEQNGLSCGADKFKSPLISHEFHYPSKNPDLLGNVLITYSSRGKIEYVSFSTIGDPGAWFSD